tara:strand:- start:2395 stop:3459 length:1065 start_codon:yes stop_codon:yes gene_type:complete
MGDVWSWDEDLLLLDLLQSSKSMAADATPLQADDKNVQVLSKLLSGPQGSRLRRTPADITNRLRWIVSTLRMALSGTSERAKSDAEPFLIQLKRGAFVSKRAAFIKDWQAAMSFDPDRITNLADAIRQHVIWHNIEPARFAARTEPDLAGEPVGVEVNAGNIHSEMGLVNHLPAVCGALDAKVFAEQARLVLASRTRPGQQGGDITWGFDFTSFVEWPSEVPRIEDAMADAATRMCQSILATVAGANGQVVEVARPLKELHIAEDELPSIIAALIEAQGRRCALSGLNLEFDGRETSVDFLPSVDRIDSEGHYAKGNLQIVCRFINYWKSARDNQEFKALLDAVKSVTPPPTHG